VYLVSYLLARLLQLSEDWSSLAVGAALAASRGNSWRRDGIGKNHPGHCILCRPASQQASRQSSDNQVSDFQFYRSVDISNSYCFYCL